MAKFTWHFREHAKKKNWCLKYESRHEINMYSGADPGFLDRGFKFRKRGLFSQFCLIFSKIPHENEII